MTTNKSCLASRCPGLLGEEAACMKMFLAGPCAGCLLDTFFFSSFHCARRLATPNIDSKESEGEEVFSCVMLYHCSSLAGFSWYPMPTSMVRTVC